MSSLAGFDGCSQGQALHISVDEPLRSSRVGARLHSPEVSPVQSRHPARAPDGWVGARSKQPPEAAFSCPRMAAVCKGVNPKGCLLLDGEEPRSSSRSIALRCPQKAATCGLPRASCRDAGPSRTSEVAGVRSRLRRQRGRWLSVRVSRPYRGSPRHHGSGQWPRGAYLGRRTR